MFNYFSRLKVSRAQIIIISILFLSGKDLSFISYADPPELRPSGSCAARKTTSLKKAIDNEESNGKANLNKKGGEKESQLPKKIIIERPRVMARLKYADWNENPMAIRNLLLFLEKDLKIPAIEIRSKLKQKASLSYEQKLSIFDQLKDFHINLAEKQGFQINQPILHGDIPPADGEGDPIAVFDVINEESQVTAESFSILFMTGLKKFNVDDKLVSRLKNYLLRGGFIMADSASSSKEFTASFIELVRKMFPDGELKPLKRTHKVFYTVYPLEHLRYTGMDKEGKSPVLYGLNIDGRTAVFLSDFSVSCGWDGHMHGENIEKELHYEDSLKLGANIIAYTLGFRKYGRDLPPFPRPPETKAELTDIIIPWIADKTYSYLYWPAVSNWLFFLKSRLNAPIRIERKCFSLKDSEILSYPFLYLPVTEDMTFTDEDKENLKKFFNSGATMFAESVFSNEKADNNFRKIMKELFPEKKLTPLENSHSIFKSFFQLDSIFYRKNSLPYSKQEIISAESLSEGSRRSKPYLEAIVDDQRLKVIYSPFDLIHSFRGHPYLGCKGVSHEDDSGLKLALNILVFILNGG